MKSLLVFKALADDSRLSVIHALLTAPLCVEELAGRLDLAASTVSFHLKKLEAAGMVRKEKQQYYVIYRADEAVFDLTLHQLVLQAKTSVEQQAKRLSDLHRKVLATFMPGGRLKKLPVQVKKRLIILEHLAELFEPGRVYPEAEVNQLLKVVDDDYCLLRRLLIDQGLLERSQGTYRRVSSATDRHLGTTPPSPSETPLPPVSPVKTPRLSTKGQKPMDQRKELKRQYLENPPAVGIFQFRNLDSGKCFVGASMNLPGALNRHKFQLEMGSHRNRELQADWKRLGPDRFVFEILDTLKPHDDGTQPTADELSDREKLWLAKLQPFGEKGYNEA